MNQNIPFPATLKLQSGPLIRYKWSYNPYKWPKINGRLSIYFWPFIRVIAPFIPSRGPLWCLKTLRFLPPGAHWRCQLSKPMSMDEGGMVRSTSEKNGVAPFLEEILTWTIFSYVFLFWVLLKETVFLLMSIVMLCPLLRGKCTLAQWGWSKQRKMKTSILVRHTKTSITDQSTPLAWQNWFAPFPLHVPWHRQRNDAMGKHKQTPLIQSVLDFQKKPYPTSLSLWFSQSHPKRKPYKCFMQLPIFCSPTPPTSL